MKKYLLNIVVLLIAIHLNAQEKVYEFEIKKGRTLTNFTNSRNGNHYIKTGKQLVMAKFKDDKLLCLDKDFNEIYKVDVNSNDFPGNPHYGDITYVTNYGEFYYNVDQLIDGKGKVKEYQGSVKGDTKKIEKQSGVNPIFQFISDYGCVFIGPKIGRKNYKKKYLDGDIKIFSMKNEDLSTTFNDLETPKFKTNKETLEWHEGDNFKDKFFLWSFEFNDDKLNKILTYYIVFYDYNGKIISETEFKIKPENKRYTEASIQVSDYFNYFTSTGYSSLNSNLFYNELTNTFSVYGYYTNPLKRKGGKSNLLGNYIAKFDIEGDIIWDKKHAYKEPVKDESEYSNMIYYEIGSKGYLIFSNEKNEASLHTLDTSNGDLINKDNNILDGFKRNIINVDKVEVKEFFSEWHNKKYKKKFFSIKAIQSMFINKAINGYVNNKSPEGFLLYYDATFLLDGSIILKEFDKKNSKIKLMKFNK